MKVKKTVAHLCGFILVASSLFSLFCFWGKCKDHFDKHLLYSAPKITNCCHNYKNNVLLLHSILIISNLELFGMFIHDWVILDFGEMKSASGDK